MLKCSKAKAGAHQILSAEIKATSGRPKGVFFARGKHCLPLDRLVRYHSPLQSICRAKRVSKSLGSWTSEVTRSCVSRPSISSGADIYTYIQEEAAAGEWAALLAKEDDEIKNTDGITAETLNEICNKGLKLMLREDTAGLLDFQEELNGLGQKFSERQDLDGALFVYVLFKMCDNTLVEQTTKLTGVYLEAFRKVFDILEDSGWALKPEGEEDEDGDGPSSLDELPNLPYMQEL